MNSAPRHLLLLCLLAACLRPLHAQSGNSHDRELRQIESGWNGASPLHKLILLDQALNLRKYVDDPAHIRTWLAQVAQSSAENELTRQEAAACFEDLNPLEGISRQVQARHWYVTDHDGGSGRREQVLAQAVEAARRGGARDLQTLAELELLAGSPAAAMNMQQAARMEPSADRWQRAAVLIDDPFRKFAALQSGLALEPGHSKLSLELASYYAGRRQMEKARDLLERAAASAPDDFVVRERLAGLYLEMGRRSAALGEMKSLEKRWPKPLWLRSRLALDYEQAGLWDDAARLARSVVEEDRQDREQLELLARIHERRHMAREAEEDYRALCSLDPQSPESRRRLAELQLGSGDLAGARDSLLRLLAIERDRDRRRAAHLRLAEVDQRLHLDQQAADERAEAVGLARTGANAAPVNPDAAFLADAQALAHDSLAHPPEAADLALADVRIEELYASGLSRIHVQQVFFVGSQAAADAHHVSSIRYSPASEELRILQARVWEPDGKVAPAQELGDREPADSIAPLHDDLRARQLRFPALAKGAVIELEYMITPTAQTSPYGEYFGELVLFSGQQSTALKRYVLIARQDRAVYVHAEKIAPASITRSGDARIFLWEAHSVPPAPREPHSPGATEISPYVHVSTMADWRQLGEWYAALVRPQFALDASLEQEVARLIRGAHTDREKIASIQDFVLRSTRYVALEFGVYSYKPYPVAQTFARRFGDCKDKASLMIAMLRAAGIDAELALVRTRSLGNVADQPASVAVFDHAVAYVPKFDLWLDGTAEYGMRELPPEDQGALALTVNLNGAAQLRRIPVSRAADNYTRRVIHGEITRQGVLHFSGSTLTRGQDAPELRHEMSVRERQLDLFRSDLAQVFPSVQVESVSVHGAEDLDGDVSVDFHGALDSFQHKRVALLRSSWMRRAYVVDLALAGARTEDLLLPPPWITEEEIHIALPAGADVRVLPPDHTITTAFGSLELHYSKSGGEILVRSRVQFEPTRVSARDYPAFRQFCSQLDRSFRSEITVGLPQ